MTADTLTLAFRAAQLLIGEVEALRPIAAGMSCEAFELVSRSDARRWVVRVPVPGTDRAIRFHAEAALGRALAVRGYPVAAWQVVEVDGVVCAVGNHLPGSPIAYGELWSPAFSAALGALLAELHALPAVGSGPLVDDATALRGESGSVAEGVSARWDRAVCWPFDGPDLADHPISRVVPEAVPMVLSRRQDVFDAAEQLIGVVHSDLHREHLLVGPSGGLSGVLDFGDAFVGSVGWDFATLRWYYGAGVSASVAEHYAAAREVKDLGRVLAIPLGLYKVAKNPGDAATLSRMRRVLADA